MKEFKTETVTKVVAFIVAIAATAAIVVAMALIGHPKTGSKEKAPAPTEQKSGEDKGLPH